MKNTFSYILLLAAVLSLFALAGCSNREEVTGPDLTQIKESKLVWADEFDYEGLPDSEKWAYEVGGSGWGNKEEQYYTEKREDNAVVKDGKLMITARKEEFNASSYTSARLVTRGKAEWLYGRIEVRAKLPSGRGTWPAIWMMPAKNLYGQWPESGEIDIMEHVGYDPGIVHASLHTGKYNFRKGNQRTATTKIPDAGSSFHTYAVEWRPGKMDFFIDDVKYMTKSFNIQQDAYDGPMSWPFDKPFYLILNIAVGGEWGGREGIDQSIFPQSMEVDYVRVYDLGFDSGRDKRPPSAPDGLMLKRSANGYSLRWKAASDNFAVSYYIVESDGGSPRNTFLNSVEFTGFKPGERHKFKITAVDNNGNRSDSKTIKLKCE